MRRKADMTTTAAEAVKGATDIVSNTSKTAGGNLPKEISVLNKTTYSPPDPSAALGNSKVTSSGDDNHSYPGLEKPLVSQQELK